MFLYFSLWDSQTKISLKITVKIKSNNTEIRASDIVQVSNRQCIIIFVHSMTVAPQLISYQRNYHISLKTYIYCYVMHMYKYTKRKVWLVQVFAWGISSNSVSFIAPFYRRVIAPLDKKSFKSIFALNVVHIFISYDW